MAMINMDKVGQSMQAHERQQVAEGLARLENQTPDQTPEKLVGAGQGALAGAAAGSPFGPPGMIIGGTLGALGGWMGSGNQVQQAANNMAALDKQYGQTKAPQINLGPAPQIQPLQPPTSFGVG